MSDFYDAQAEEAWENWKRNDENKGNFEEQNSTENQNNDKEEEKKELSDSEKNLKKIEELLYTSAIFTRPPGTENYIWATISFPKNTEGGGLCESGQWLDSNRN